MATGCAATTLVDDACAESVAATATAASRVDSAAIVAPVVSVVSAADESCLARTTFRPNDSAFG
jgi:hypothetical protein